MRLKKLIILNFLFFAFLHGMQAQKMVRILHSDKLQFSKEISDAQRLVGNVSLAYKEVKMFCDSAYLFPNEDFQAFGSIRIVQGDSLALWGEQLQFKSADKKAYLKNNVRMTDRDMTLVTNNLEYHLETAVANYYGGGTITSKANNNTLKSKQGSYFSKSEDFYFRGNVELKNPEYRVESDTLKYNSLTQKSYFFGPTKIFSTDSEIYCENGWYDSGTEICQFNKNAVVYSGKNILKGDSIYYDGKRSYGEVFGNVSITDTSNAYAIHGDYGWHEQIEQKSLVTGNARMIQVFENDSLYLHADTLQAIPDGKNFQRLLAHHHVRFFKPDLQGKSDSLVFAERDSMIYFFGNPVLWSQSNQLSADSVSIRSYNGVIDKLFMKGRAFIASEELPGRFNQIKGREMTGIFIENQLRKVFVNGNGETIYFPEDEKGEKRESGINKVACSNIIVEVDDNTLQRIVFQVKPSGVLKPGSQVNASDRILEGFNWRGPERPTSAKDLYQNQ
jgi:lipopolysaccharide export system protein LptA